jgi:proline iminopeptidase
MALRERYALYPTTEPYREGRLNVGDGHEIYFEECGDPDARPVIIVHGGPGGGSNPTMRRFHNPKHYRIILFDQRGCGRSIPNAALEDNTTWHLVADMERLREHLGVERWQVFGGSWGSTLALAYAQKYPERVTALVLRGIFLLRRCELDWFYQDGCSWIYPDAWEAFERVIPEDERSDMIGAYHRRLTHSDPRVQLEAATAWSVWEGTTLSLLEDPERIKRFSVQTYAMAFARIECHYFRNAGFFARDGELLLNAHRLHSVPGTIVHGRYDMVTPLKNAWDLKKAWPGADLRIVPDAGHAMTEPGLVHELVSATRRYARSGPA